MKKLNLYQQSKSQETFLFLFEVLMQQSLPVQKAVFL